MDKELKLCPYLPQKEERKAMMVGNGDITVTYFLPCIKDKCAAFVNCGDNGGKCGYNGAMIDVYVENE
jgi:hypothetical protein